MKGTLINSDVTALIVIGVACPLFALKRLRLQAKFSLHGSSINFTENLLLSITNLQFLIYFIIPLLLVKTILILRKESTELYVIRHGSNARWLASCLTVKIVETLKVYGAILLSGLAASWGLQPSLAWGEWTHISHSDQRLLTLPAFDPYLLIFVQVVLFVSMIAGIHLAACLLYRFFNKVLSVGFLCSVWILAIAQMHQALLFMPINVIDAFSVLQSSRDGGSLLKGVVPLVLIVAISFGIVFVLDRRLNAQLKKYLTYMSACILLGCLVLISVLNKRWESMNEAFYMTFLGVSGRGFFFTPYLLLTIITVAPLVIYALKLEVQIQMLPIIIVRSGSVIKWWFRSTSLAFAAWFLIMFSLSLIGVLSVVIKFANGRPQLPIFPPISTAAPYFIITSTLQGFLYIQLLFLGRLFLGKESFVPWFLCGLAASGFILGPIDVVPVFKQSLGLFRSWPHSYPVIALLSALNIIVAVTTMLLIRRFAVQLMERNLYKCQ